MISEFKNEYRWLSNFYPSVIEWDGIIYPTVEHAYQGLKTNNIEDRKHIASLDTPGKAKKAGKTLKLRDDWVSIKLDLMKQLLDIKFSSEPLRSKLLGTGDELLEEGNFWHDIFWGVDLVTRKGENHLGKLLMEIRSEIR